MLSTSWKVKSVSKLRIRVGQVCYSSNLPAETTRKERKPTVIDPDASEFIAADQVRYPAVRPKYPPSRWSYGSTSEKTAWDFQLRAESLRRQPTVFEKAYQFNLFEAKDNFYDIALPYTMPNALKFAQLLTRTHFVEASETSSKGGGDQESKSKSEAKKGLPETLFAGLSEEALQSISQRAAPLLLQLARRAAQSKEASTTVLEDMLDTLVLAISASKQSTSATKAANMAAIVQELERAQVAHSGRVQTFWRRSGFERVAEIDLKKIPSMSEYLKYVRKRVRDEFGHARFTLQAETSWQMRSPLPMQPLFADRLYVAATQESVAGATAEASEGGAFAAFWNAPRHTVAAAEQAACDPAIYFDLPRRDLHTFWHIHKQHFARLHELPRLGRNLPAFWPRSPFWPGDPAEFPLLAVMRLDSTQFGEAYGQQLVADVVRTNALLTAFGWSVASAFNQGYTLYDQLDYPISAFAAAYDTSQRSLSLCAFQLNALNALWKAADCADPLNVAAFSQTAPLFQLDSSTQRVAMNESLVRLLLATLLRGSVKMPVLSTTDLSPHVQQQSATLHTFPFERTKVTEPDYVGQVRDTLDTDKSEASEKAALVHAETHLQPNDVTYSFGLHPSCRGVPSRLWRIWLNVKGEADFARLSDPPAVLKRRWTARLHPNERYYARLCDPRDILFDIRRTYPRLRIPVRLLKIKNPMHKLHSKRFRENLELMKREVDEPYRKVIHGDWNSRGRI